MIKFKVLKVRLVLELRSEAAVVSRYGAVTIVVLQLLILRSQK